MSLKTIVHGVRVSLCLATFPHPPSTSTYITPDGFLKILTRVRCSIRSKSNKLVSGFFFFFFREVMCGCRAIYFGQWRSRYGPFIRDLERLRMALVQSTLFRTYPFS